MFKRFKEKSFKEKVYNSIEGGLKIPKNLIGENNPMLEKISPYFNSYNIHLKPTAWGSRDIHIMKIYLSDNSIELMVERRSIILFEKEIIELMNNLKDYFKINPTCNIFDGGTNEVVDINNIKNINIHIEPDDNIVIIEKKKIYNCRKVKYRAYVYDHVYKDYLILSDKNIDSSRLKIVEKLLDSNYSVSELNTALVHNNFNVIELLI